MKASSAIAAQRFLSSGTLDLDLGALDERTSTARAEESPASVALHRERWFPDLARKPHLETARRYRAGPAEAARAPRLVRIRIKHHLLQFLLYIKRLVSNNLTTNVHRNLIGSARDDHGRLIRQRRHSPNTAALHDVDELPVPLVRGHGVLDVLVETNNMRFPLLVDLCVDA